MIRHLSRNITKKKDHTIGLLLPDIANPFYRETIMAIEKGAFELGYHLLLSMTQNELHLEKESIQFMQSNGIEGLLITPALLNDPNVEELIREGFPVLLLFRRVNRRSLKEQIGYVGVDNRHGGYIGVEHLIRLGHSNIVLFSGPLTSSESLEWIDGAKEAFLTYGVNWDKANVLTMDPSKKSGYEGAKRFLESPKRPSAFFVMGDWVAFGVYEAILEMGLRIPEDVALVGFNDIEFTSLRSISMTTLGQKHYELGVFAAGTLVEKIEGRGDSFTKEIVFKPKLLVRSTCGFSISGYRREAVLKESAEVLLETILID